MTITRLPGRWAEALRRGASGASWRAIFRGGGGPGPEPTSTSGTWKAVRVIGEQRLFRDIVLRVADGGSVDGSLVYLNEALEEVRRIDFFGIVPISFDTLRIDSSQGAILRETLEFSVSRVELGSAPPGAGRFFTNRFRLYLDGQAVDSVISVHPGPIFFDSPDPELISFIPPTLTGGQQYLRSYGFGFNLLGGDDRDWFGISGGEMQFARFGSRELEITFSEVELYGPMVSSVDRREMVEWLNGWLKAEGTITQSTLEIFRNDGSTEAMVDYQQVVPASYSTSPLNAQEDDIRVHEFLTLKARVIEVQ